MIDLGSTEFVLAIPSFPEEELRSRSSELFDSWEAFVGNSVSVPDYSLLLEVEEGSVKGRATIGAALAAFYFGIGNYGDFISGLKTIGEQVSATGDYLSQQAGRVFSCPPSRTTSKKRGGSPAALHRLFVRVQKGELTPEEAMIRAQNFLGDEASTEPDFMRELADALLKCPRYHQQQPLPYLEQADELNPPMEGEPRTPRPSRSPSPVLGPPLQLRVEVWRESKNKRKQTRIIKL